ncbi:MAG TPA: UxaA family hydrolase [Steroidobacteraceae bacterium]|nr:UxaA family hydrolase [Steroidobacteraceae bacterium]
MSSSPISPLLLLHPDDNSLVARRSLQAGEEVVIDGETIRMPQAIALGHKVARHALTAGTEILKYGAPIGSTTKSVMKGEHLHLHNLKSDYIATHTRQGTSGSADH